VENSLEIPNCKPDAPFKTHFLEQMNFAIPSHIKVPYLGIDLVIPKVPNIEIDSLISCFKDLPMDYYEILYLSVRMLIAAIPMLIIYHPM
jgi:hypothetical protein